MIHQGLIWWINEQILSGLDHYMNKFNKVILNNLIEMVKMENEHKGSHEANDKPHAIEVGNWINWDEAKLVDYFNSVYNTKNIPQLYVDPKDATKEHTEMSRDEQVIYSAPLEGLLFDVDTKDVPRVSQKCEMQEDCNAETP